jgi:hypothetical protein
VRAVIGDLLRPEKARSRREDDTVMRFAAGTLVGWYGAQTPGAVRQALKRYRKFRKITPFWQ